MYRGNRRGARARRSSELLLRGSLGLARNPAPARHVSGSLRILAFFLASVPRGARGRRHGGARRILVRRCDARTLARFAGRLHRASSGSRARNAIMMVSHFQHLVDHEGATVELRDRASRRHGTRDSRPDDRARDGPRPAADRARRESRRRRDRRTDGRRDPRRARRVDRRRTCCCSRCSAPATRASNAAPAPPRRAAARDRPARPARSISQRARAPPLPGLRAARDPRTATPTPTRARRASRRRAAPSRRRATISRKRTATCRDRRDPARRRLEQRAAGPVRARHQEREDVDRAQHLGVVVVAVAGEDDAVRDAESRGRLARRPPRGACPARRPAVARSGRAAKSRAAALRAADRNGGGAGRARRFPRPRAPAAKPERRPRAVDRPAPARSARDRRRRRRRRSAARRAEPALRRAVSGRDAEQAVRAGAEEPAIPRRARDPLGAAIAADDRGAALAARESRAGGRACASSAPRRTAFAREPVAQTRNVGCDPRAATRRAPLEREHRARSRPRSRLASPASDSPSAGAPGWASATSWPRARWASASRSIGSAGPVHFQSLVSWRILIRPWMRRRSPAARYAEGVRDGAVLPELHVFCEDVERGGRRR